MQERLVALVTGGSRGIGAETALAFADRGYDVVLTYRNKAARAEEVVATITQRGGQALVAADPDYPMHINRDTQLELVKAALPLLRPGGVIVFVTSHWAHLYGQIQQLPAYEPVAESKHAGELALRALQPELDAGGWKLLVVTGDLVEGTITPKLLERTAPGLIGQRRATQGELPTARDMGREIVRAALDPTRASGTTIVVGAPLESMLNQ